MSTAREFTVTFPIENGMFGLDRLAKLLNELVSNGRIADWHPGRWIDWGHTAIQIRFDSVEDATLAKRLLSQGHGEVAIPEAGRTLNAGERRAPE